MWSTCVFWLVWLTSMLTFIDLICGNFILIEWMWMDWMIVKLFDNEYDLWWLYEKMDHCEGKDWDWDEMWLLD